MSLVGPKVERNLDILIGNLKIKVPDQLRAFKTRTTISNIWKLGRFIANDVLWYFVLLLFVVENRDYFMERQ